MNNIQQDIDAAGLEDGLDALRIGLLIVDPDDVVAYANAHFSYLFPESVSPVGASVDAFLESIASQIAQNADAWRLARAERRDNGEAAPLDLALTDGRVLEVKERLLERGEGSVLLWHDATALRRQTARLEDIIEASSEGFAFFDAKGGLDLWNDGFAVAIGGETGVAAGRTMGALLAAARGSGRVELLGDPPPFDALASTPQRRDFLFRHRDGRFLRLRMRPSRAGGAVAVITDITAERAQSDALAQRGAALAETKAALRDTRGRMRMQTASLLGLKEELFRARREADEADLAKQAFLRTMSHELRTPLNSIIGFAEIVEQGIHGPVGAPQYAEYASLILDSGRRLLRIINRILDITRLESGAAALAVDAEPLTPIIAAALEAHRPAAERAELSLAHDIADDVIQVLAEEGAVRAMLDNLLDNAIINTEPGGVITVRARANDDHVAVTVSDTGCGIAPADIERVMLPFEQGRDCSSEYSEGVGLGLPVVKALAEALGGAFELSSALGRGTDAVITLRAPGAAAAETNEDDDEAAE